jgi:hypothetical protein
LGKDEVVVMRAKRKHPEADLQRACVQWFRLQYKRPWRCFHIPNGEKRDARTAAILKAMGVEAGVADLCVIIPGLGIAFVELKAPGGRLTQAQKDFQDDCRKAGIIHETASDLEKFMMLVEIWATLSRARRYSS